MMMELRYDTDGILWRARADKAAVMRRHGEMDDDDEESSGVDTENEDVDETDFDFNYMKALDYRQSGDLPLLPEATARGLPRRAAAPAGGKRRRSRAPVDAFAFDASQQTQPTTYAPSQEGEDAFNVLGDPLASQASFPFSQLPEVSFLRADEGGGSENGSEEGDGGGEVGKLPDFLTDLLDEKDGGNAGGGRSGKGVLMYQLSQTDYLQDHIAPRKEREGEKKPSSSSAKTKRPRN